MKDSNIKSLNKKETVVRIDQKQQEYLKKIIQADAKFLASLGIMDYSLFLVVEKNKTPEKKAKIH